MKKTFFKKAAVLLSIVAALICTTTAYASEDQSNGRDILSWIDDATVTSAGRISFGSSDSPDSSNSESAALAVDPVDVETYARRVLELVNIERESAGLDAVVWNDDLAAGAQIRAEELQYTYSHDRPNGQKPSSAAQELGIVYQGLAENILAQRSTPEAAVQAWMDSEAHRNSILKPSQTRGGVGIYYTPEAGQTGYNWHWVLWFDKY